jgi:hypothetical protein
MYILDIFNRSSSLMDHGHQSWTRLHRNVHERTEMPKDVHKSRSWALVHHAMFHTYPHHDAEGYGTFIQALSGTKYWVIMRPKEEQMERSQLYRDQIQFRSETLDYDQSWNRWLIVPEPGDIMYVFLSPMHSIQ